MRLQVCGQQEREALPEWLQREWALADEQVLVEARVSLLKLVARMDALCALRQLSCSRGQGDSTALQQHEAAPLQKQASLKGLDAEVQRLQEQISCCMQLASARQPSTGQTQTQQGSEPAGTASGGMPEAAAAGLLEAHVPPSEPGQGAGMIAIEEKHERDALVGHVLGTNTRGRGSPDQADGGEQGPETGQRWLLSPESMHSIGRGGSSSLVFVNPRTLLSALGRSSLTAPYFRLTFLCPGNGCNAPYSGLQVLYTAILYSGRTQDAQEVHAVL